MKSNNSPHLTFYRGLDFRISDAKTPELHRLLLQVATIYELSANNDLGRSGYLDVRMVSRPKLSADSFVAKYKKNGTRLAKQKMGTFCVVYYATDPNDGELLDVEIISRQSANNTQKLICYYNMLLKILGISVPYHKFFDVEQYSISGLARPIFLHREMLAVRIGLHCRKITKTASTGSLDACIDEKISEIGVQWK